MKRTLAALVLLLGAAGVRAGSVIGSKHDLSMTGPGDVRALAEQNPCVFCHTPHRAGATGVLSNRPDNTAVYTPYTSSTELVNPGSPTGATRICLSCHDGTIAIGQTRTGAIAMTVDFLGARTTNIGTDLRKTHPVSFVPSNTAATHGPPGGDPVRLDASGQLQCTACHDPHAQFPTTRGKFLVRTTEFGELCSACHTASSYGAGASHALSGATFGPAEGNDGAYFSVANAGCAACHAQHGATTAGRLVKKSTADDDTVCLRCHGSSVTLKNIATDVAKASNHAQGSGVHDAAEGPGKTPPLPETSAGATRHAACVDCHSPHLATSRPSVGAPAASGLLDGVWGINVAGARVAQVQFEYEVCFKCHADSANQPQALGPTPPETLRRAVTDVNLRRQLANGAASYHPVVSPGLNASVPGLLLGLTPASQIYCGDCHASNTSPGAGGSGPKGPHGSIYPHLLERAYTTTDPTVESAGAYALCYKCHDRTTLLSAASNFGTLHQRHVVTASTPCSVCHASHGVSSVAGNATNNAHLVDFDVSVVQQNGGLRRYVASGPHGGGCTLTCHSYVHVEAIQFY